MQLLDEPPARKPRQSRQRRKMYLHKNGQVIPFVNKADLLAYIASMRKGK